MKVAAFTIPAMDENMLLCGGCAITIAAHLRGQEGGTIEVQETWIEHGPRCEWCHDPIGCTCRVDATLSICEVCREAANERRIRSKEAS